MGTRVETARPVRKAISVQHRMMTAWTRVVVMKMKRILSILRETSGFGLEAKSVGIFFNFFFLSALCGLRDLSSLTVDGTRAPCSGSVKP